MSNTVFILGAGASKDAGAPLMDDFLGSARNLWESGERAVSQDDFKLVFEAIDKLQAAHSKSQLNTVNIESVFGAIEMARTIKSFPGFKPNRIMKLFKAMNTVIWNTLENRVKYPVINNIIHPPNPYSEFTDLLNLLKNDIQPNHNITIITFNYDLACDYALYSFGFEYDYGFNENPSPGTISLLKLHGSLNWFQIRQTKKIYPWYLKQYFTNRKFIDLSKVKEVIIPVNTHIEDIKECTEKDIITDPVIVPPTWNKTYHHKTVSKVWNAAAKQLSSADNIFVIGYSLPSSDMFFHFLWSLGTIGDSHLRRLWIFNPDDSNEIKTRYESLLGPGARSVYQYKGDNFEDAIPVIRDVFE